MKTKKPMQKKPSQKNIKTKTIIVDKNPVGNQPKYAKWMDGVAERLAKQGNNQKVIYQLLGITEATGISYKKKYPSFSKALEDGYKDPIKIAEDRLHKLVKGYEFDSEQLLVVSDGAQLGSHVERVPIKKRIEPNLRAIEFFLKNRKSWKENPKDGWGEMIEISGKMEYKVIPDETLEDKE